MVCLFVLGSTHNRKSQKQIDPTAATSRVTSQATTSPVRGQDNALPLKEQPTSSVPREPSIARHLHSRQTQTLWADRTLRCCSSSYKFLPCAVNKFRKEKKIKFSPPRQNTAFRIGYRITVFRLFQAQAGRRGASSRQKTPLRSNCKHGTGLTAGHSLTALPYPLSLHSERSI